MHQISDDIPVLGGYKNLLRVRDMSAEISMILNGVKSRRIKLCKGWVCILAM